MPLPRKAQRGYYLLLGGYQRLEGLVHGSKLLLQLPGSAGGSRHRSEGKACPCGLWPGELPDQCAQCPTQSLGSSTVPFAPPGQPYLSATSALSSERSSSPSRITSFLAT